MPFLLLWKVPLGMWWKDLHGTGMTHARIDRSTAALKTPAIFAQESSVRLAHSAKIPFERTKKVANKLHNCTSVSQSSIADAYAMHITSIRSQAPEDSREDFSFANIVFCALLTVSRMCLAQTTRSAC